MKFATISTLRHTTQPALVIEDRIHTLPFADMYAVMEVGAEKAAKKASKDSLAADEVRFLSPLKPFTLRDGYAFEQHVKTANKNRGREVPQEWYEFPVFYFTNPMRYSATKMSSRTRITRMPWTTNSRSRRSSAKAG
jgi:hypothetical protein